MLHHPKYPEYVAVNNNSLPHSKIRKELFKDDRACFDCPSRDCTVPDEKGQPSDECLINGVWMHTKNIALLALNGYTVKLDMQPKSKDLDPPE